MVVKNTSDVAHTDEEPPKYGSKCLLAIGWITNRRNADKKTETANVVYPGRVRIRRMASSVPYKFSDCGESAQG
jgi:hypothetical protein